MAEVINMPKLGFDMAEGILVRWVIAEGKEVSKGEVLAEIETDKATVEVESAYEGMLSRHLVKEGDIVPVGDPIGVVAAAGEEVNYEQLLGESGHPAESAHAEAQPEGQPPEPTRAEPAADGEGDEQEAHLPGGVKASPVARRMAEEHDIDLQRLKGRGPGGRIVKEDIEAYLEAPPEAVITPAPAEKEPAPLPVYTQIGAVPEDEVVPLNRLRAAIGRRMTEVKQQVPHFYVTHQYDMAPVMNLRKQVNAVLPDDEKTSVNDYVLKAVALALRQYPNLNAALNGNQIVRHGHINIGVAVAVDGGLLTVVCRDTDRKPIRQIAIEVRTMASRARNGKVRPEDIEGSTFSVSNLGMFDVEHFIAIINPPEAGILAVGSVREIPVVKEGSIVPGLRMNATISVDHRVSDGAEAAQFLQSLERYFKEPFLLLI